jgi:hypothetical protein
VSGAMVGINQMAVQTGSDGYYRAIVSSGQTLTIKSQYGNTTAGPLQPDAAACAPDIGTCSGTPCSAGGTSPAATPDAGAPKKDAGADAAPISQWGCSTTKDPYGRVTGCVCVFAPPEPDAPDPSCGTVTDCCYTFQSDVSRVCTCLMFF